MWYSSLLELSLAASVDRQVHQAPPCSCRHGSAYFDGFLFFMNIQIFFFIHKHAYMTPVQIYDSSEVNNLLCRLGGLPSCVKCISYPENCDNCFIDTVLLADRNFSKENKISESSTQFTRAKSREGRWMASCPLCQRQTRQ